MCSYTSINACRMSSVTLWAAFLCLLSCSLSDPLDSRNWNSEARASFHQRLAANLIRQSSLQSINGDVQIIGAANTDSVDVTGERVVRSGSQRDAEAHLELLQVEVVKADSAIVFRTRQPDRSEGRTYQVDYRIRLPRSVRVIVEAINGAVSVESVSNGIRIASINGHTDQ